MNHRIESATSELRTLARHLHWNTLPRRFQLRAILRDGIRSDGEIDAALDGAITNGIMRPGYAMQPDGDELDTWETSYCDESEHQVEQDVRDLASILLRRAYTRRAWPIDAIADAHRLLDEAALHLWGPAGLRQPPDEPPRPGRRRKARIPAALRAQVYERDGHACIDCGATTDLTCDHIHPESAGGPTTLDNLATRCRSCNSRKGTRLPTPTAP